jgi:hypothetical protein
VKPTRMPVHNCLQAASTCAFNSSMRSMRGDFFPVIGVVFLPTVERRSGLPGGCVIRTSLYVIFVFQRSVCCPTQPDNFENFNE